MGRTNQTLMRLVSSKGKVELLAVLTPIGIVGEGGSRRVTSSANLATYFYF